MPELSLPSFDVARQRRLPARAHQWRHISGYRCTLQRSADLGKTATTLTTITSACVIAIDPSSGGQVLYGYSYDLNSMINPNVYRSIDGGRNWSHLAKNSISATGLRVGADGTVYAMRGRPYVSHDRGETWTTFAEFPTETTPPSGQFFVSDIAAWRHKKYGDKFALAASNGGIYVTMDAGDNWRPAGLQGFMATRVTPIENPDTSTGEAVISYRGGLALWTDGVVEPYSAGLPGDDGTTFGVFDERLVTSPAGLSTCPVSSGCRGGTLPQTATLIEFHNRMLDHYFMTADPVEAEAIDNGSAGPGWSRTGPTFEVFRNLAGNLQTGTCRFYGRPGVGPNFHFFTIDPAECAAVRADPGWMLESASGFIATAPQHRTFTPGSPQVWDCWGGRMLYRRYNNRFAKRDSNHRYVADPEIYRSMQAKGWVGEGPRLCVR